VFHIWTHCGPSTRQVGGKPARHRVKSEDRRSKAERRPKLESPSASGFGLRISGSAGLRFSRLCGLMERGSTSSDNERGLGAGYGVPALAGRALSLGGGSQYLEIQGEIPSRRLKPELHTLSPPALFRAAQDGVRPPTVSIVGHRMVSRPSALGEYLRSTSVVPPWYVRSTSVYQTEVLRTYHGGTAEVLRR